MKKKSAKKLSDALLPASEEGTKPKRGGWSAERRAAHEAKVKGQPHKGSGEATALGVPTFLRHAAAEVFKDIRGGEVTLRTIPRRDALVLLAYVDTRDFK